MEIQEQERAKEQPAQPVADPILGKVDKSGAVVVEQSDEVRRARGGRATASGRARPSGSRTSRRSICSTPGR